MDDKTFVPGPGDRVADEALARTVPSAPAAPPLAPDGRVGRFLLLQLLGSGGMGVVWSAYDPQLDRKVALKFVRADLEGDASHTLSRLMREAQALAQVSHPNVIAVHDIGTDGERVYLAEEFVRGMDLGAWLAAAPRTGREVLEVFGQAGRGLAAAHAAGVVHRDFKPANVLVGDDGRVRVVDFGLAQAPRAAPATSGSGEAAPSLALTQTGAMLGTPLYMSPEQHVGAPTDARSDQFSFCVSLYEALHGERPFGGETLLELTLQVQSGQVRPPPRAGAGRGAVPPWQRAALLRGLSLRPEDRFPDMAALLAALATDPQARLRRRMAGLGLGLLVLALLAAGLRQGSLAQGRCQGAGPEVARVWSPERQAAGQAAFLATGLPFAQQAWDSASAALSGYARDWAAMRTEACERTHFRGEQSEEVLDLRMTCLSQRLQELDAAAALLARADPKVVERSAELSSGLTALSGCADVAALQAPVRLPRQPATRQRVEAVRAQLAQARALEEAGRFPEGAGLAAAALAGAEDAGYSPVQAEALAVLGQLQMDARADEDATRSLEAAFHTALAARHDEVALRSALLMLQHLADDQVRLEAAHGWARLAADLAERGRATAADQARLHQRQADLLHAEGKVTEALAEAEGALGLLTPDGPPLQRASVHNLLGVVLSDAGQGKASIPHYQEALALRTQALGPEHPRVADVLTNLGAALCNDERFEEALAAERRALAIWDRVLGPDSPPAALGLASLGTALRGAGRFEEALAAQRHALAIREKALAPGHPDLGSSHRTLALTLEEAGRPDEALAEYRTALALLLRAYGPAHLDVAACRYDLGALLFAQGKLPEARALLADALPVFEKSTGPDSLFTAGALDQLGRLDLALHQPALAVPSLERAIAALEARSPDAEELVGDRFALAQALWATSPEHARPLALARQALEGARASPKLQKLAAEVEAWLRRRGP